MLKGDPNSMFNSAHLETSTVVKGVSTMAIITQHRHAPPWESHASTQMNLTNTTWTQEAGHKGTRHVIYVRSKTGKFSHCMESQNWSRLAGQEEEVGGVLVKGLA